MPASTLAAANSGNAGSSTAAAVGSATIASPVCFVFARNLGYGMRGSDVANLQSYLAANTKYAGGATGYFGPLTRAAVAAWQAANKISSTGYIGPLSRAKISCPSNETTTSVMFNANPLSGTAPLAVDFSVSLKNAGQYIIEFGDGANSGPLQSRCLSSNSSLGAPNAISCGISAEHSYKIAGDYTATLLPYIACLYATTGVRCMIATMPLGQVKITAR